VTGVALEREEDRQRAAHQQLRLTAPVGCLQRRREIVEADRIAEGSILWGLRMLAAGLLIAEDAET
jgi:hypothetical protein